MTSETRVCRIHAARDLRIDTLELGEPGPGQVLLKMRAGGICGSDLHYYQDGGFGAIRVREPMVLGHEVSGEVVSTGPGVEGLAPGTRVAVNPSHPCNACEYCLQGLQQHCLNMTFFGSAMPFPHSQGAFREMMVVAATQCEPLGDVVSFGEGACAEPLAVCLHAGNRAGDLKGKRVIVTGAGPIGSLCVAVAKFGGASEIVVTDLQDATLKVAEAMGATRAVNTRTNPDGLKEYEAGKGYFDVAFDCSAAAPAIRSLFPVLRPQARFVQVGTGGDATIALAMLVAKEIEWAGAQRFHAEYPLAVKMIAERRIDVRPIITGTFPLADAVAAFDAAGDRSKAVKVQLELA
ncbi:L-idonate 5-dehydrogenase [Oceanicella sp. SM1341]|uniref:L-idonate 5-dehydrogenase n=1 Tax=Oceanicella sp. SM1341 TaxID=1548889 RepID=UPI000E4F4041|nr:L-idonate 5-dehydrogenase [Oceanicella sp. SM1341]